LAAKEVTLGPDARRAIDEIREIFPRIDDVITGWSFRLARDPEKGALRIAGTEPAQYVIRTPTIPMSRFSLTLRYTVSEGLITHIKLNPVAP
jgi:hypothetical protein